MISIAEEVKRIVRASPFLEEGLSRGLINYSALAREIQAEIETNLLKPVSTSSILVALKRLSEKLEPVNQSKIQRSLLVGSEDLTVRSNLISFSYNPSNRFIECQKRLLEQVPDQNLYLTITHAVTQTTVLATASLETIVEHTFAAEELVNKVGSLSALIIKFAPGAMMTPGIHYPIFRQLSWNNINVIEVISTYQELILVMSRTQVDKAFKVLLKFLAG